MVNKFYKKLRKIELKKNPTKEDIALFPLLHQAVFGFKEPIQLNIKEVKNNGN